MTQGGRDAAEPWGNKRILITTMGTRGDVQPFVALALGLMDRGWQVGISAPAEFQGFVESHGIVHLDAGRSLQREILESPEGRALRTAGPLTTLQATRSFFSVELLESWFRAISEHCGRLQPDVLLLTSFPALSGAAIIPRLLGLTGTQVVVAHTVPMAPTGEFKVPLSGRGFSARWPVLNRLQWAASSALVGRGIHAKTAQRVVQRAVEELQAQYQRLLPGKASLEIGPQFGLADVPTLYIYSPSLLPKPSDWPANTYVVGPLLLRHQYLQQAVASDDVAMKDGGTRAGGQGIPCHRTAPADMEPAASGGGCSSTIGDSQGAASLPADHSRPEQHDSPQDSPSHPAPTVALSEDSSSFVIPASRDGPSGPTEPNGSSSSSNSASSQSHSGHPADPAGRYSELSRRGGNGIGITLAVGGKAALKEELQGCVQQPAVGLPAPLQAYLDEAFRHQLPVVYIGLGSMLGTVFEPEQINHVLDCITQGVVQLAERRPVRAVIHTALGGGRSAQLGGGIPPGAPFMLLDQPVAHNLLLPQCSLVVHHGGAGTTHATLAAGKPALVVPCVPSSDQSFWGDLVWRRGLGPQWFPISRLSPRRLAQGLEEGLQRLEELTVNAERMAAMLHQEDGVGVAVEIIEAAARQ